VESVKKFWVMDPESQKGYRQCCRSVNVRGSAILTYGSGSLSRIVGQFILDTQDPVPDPT